MTASESAIAEIRAVVLALAKLNRPASIADIVAASNLDRRVVVRRLRSAPHTGLFRVNYPAHFVRDSVTGLWRLTAAGIYMAEAGK